MNPIKTFVQLINALFFLRLTIRGRILPGFKPKKDDLVIDLGCGDKPFWRADVLLDNSKLGNEHRYSSSGINKEIGYYVDSDLTKTPFSDKTFDFSFCSHVLEHVQRPDLAIKEIMRISHKGYLEVPNGIMEMIYPYQGHLWFIYQIKDELIFIRKGKGLHQALSIANSKYYYLTKLVKNPVINFYWEGSIKFRIIDELKQSERFLPTHIDKNVQPSYIHTIYILLIKFLRKLFYKNKGERIKLLRERLMRKHV